MKIQILLCVVLTSQFPKNLNMITAFKSAQQQRANMKKG